VAPQAPGLPESPLLARAGPPQAPGPAKRPHPPRPSGQGGTDPEPDARASGEGSEGVKRARRHERAPQGLPAQEASSPSADEEAAERPDEEEAPAAPQGRKDDPVRRALAEAPAAPRSRKDEAAQDEALKKKTLEALKKRTSKVMSGYGLRKRGSTSRAADLGPPPKAKQKMGPPQARAPQPESESPHDEPPQAESPQTSYYADSSRPPRAVHGQIRIALLELFAGMRGASRALEMLPVTVVGTMAVECNPYLNEWAKVRWPDEVVIPDIDHVDEILVHEFLEDLPPFDIVLIVGGFPCKDLSRLKTGRKNLEGAHSRLFFHLPEIRERVIKSTNAPVRFLVENVMCDTDALSEISRELAVKPYRITSTPVSAASRDRLYWVDSTWSAQKGEEVVTTNPLFAVVKLRERDKRLEVLDKGSKFHADFGGRLPCVTGYHPSERQPRHPAGYEQASNTAKKRWEADGYATQVYHYEDFNMVWDHAPQAPSRGKATKAIIESKWEEHFHYIGPGTSSLGLAPSIWANPHSTSKEDGGASLEAYRKHVRSDRSLQEALPGLRGAHLLCSHCDPGEPCHGDILIDEYDRIARRQKEPTPRLMRIDELERVMGFQSEDHEGPSYLAGPKQGLSQRELYRRQRDALGNAFNVHVVRRILWNILVVAGLAIGESTPQSLATSAWPHRRASPPALARTTSATSAATGGRMRRAGRPVPLAHAPRRPRHSGRHAPSDNAGAAEATALAGLVAGGQLRGGLPRHGRHPGQQPVPPHQAGPGPNRGRPARRGRLTARQAFHIFH
jgi:site-specific DNA-cytosine methylase